MAYDIRAGGTLAESLRELRRVLDLSWDELAALFGVSPRAGLYWSSGAHMSSRNQQRLEQMWRYLRGLTRAQVMASSASGPSLYRSLVREAAKDRRPYNRTISLTSSVVSLVIEGR